jgi:hypothetical protein
MPITRLPTAAKLQTLQIKLALLGGSEERAPGIAWVLHNWTILVL